MDVKQAVLQAKVYVTDLFEGEQLADMGLEEVEYEEARSEWLITIGFSRPWDKPKNKFAGLLDDAVSSRSYKVVSISDATGSVRYMKNYEIQH